MNSTVTAMCARPATLPGKGLVSWERQRPAGVYPCASDTFRTSASRPLVPLLLSVLLIQLYLAAAEPKKLIEFGWDEPDTAFLRTNVEQMAQTPFEGCVFHADYHNADGTNGSFTWQAWGQQAFTESDLATAFADLKEMRRGWGRFEYNFLRFNTTPAKLDWFDDYSAVASNAGLAARLARAGGCPGILFDIEQYEAPLFNYRKQRDAETKSWELYAAQVHYRGAEVMRAFQKNYPGLTIFLTFGYSLPWSETSHGKKTLADCKYGLLAPFLDGMVEAAAGKIRLIDGYELSYGYKTAAQFTTARQTVRKDLLPIVRDPDKYLRVFSLAFGVWMDRDWRTRGWDPADISKNYFSPKELGASVKAALASSDEFVWIYSESPRWWSGGGDPKRAIQQAYSDALRKARAW
jgi:hypothetical protein